MSSNYEYKGVITEKELKQVFFGAISMEHTWNYERMMNDGYLYAMLPALKKIYPDPEDFKDACKRHLEFFNNSTRYHIAIGNYCCDGRKTCSGYGKL